MYVRRAAATKFDREQAIIDAAKELGDSGADLYKVEMPLYGKGARSDLLTASQRLNGHINMPWVILSSGVDEKLFPRAVRVAMEAGASGFPGGTRGLVISNWFTGYRADAT